MGALVGAGKGAFKGALTGWPLLITGTHIPYVLKIGVSTLGGAAGGAVGGFINPTVGDVRASFEGERWASGSGGGDGREKQVAMRAEAERLSGRGFFGHRVPAFLTKTDPGPQSDQARLAARLLRTQYDRLPPADRASFVDSVKNGDMSSIYADTPASVIQTPAAGTAAVPPTATTATGVSQPGAGQSTCSSNHGSSTVAQFEARLQAGATQIGDLLAQFTGHCHSIDLVSSALDAEIGDTLDGADLPADFAAAITSVEAAQEYLSKAIEIVTTYAAKLLST